MTVVTEDIARVVLAYLDRHPSAADDAVGVATVWLPAMGLDAPPDRVVSVLSALASQGLVKAQRSLSGNTVYSKS